MQEQIAIWKAHEQDKIAQLRALLEDARRERDRYWTAAIKQSREIEQVLGAALRYPRYCDSPANFPDATPEDGVCVGDHCAESLAEEAAAVIERYRAALAQYANPSNWIERDYDGLERDWIGEDAGPDLAEKALAGGEK